MIVFLILYAVAFIYQTLTRCSTVEVGVINSKVPTSNIDGHSCESVAYLPFITDFGHATSAISSYVIYGYLSEKNVYDAYWGLK